LATGTPQGFLNQQDSLISAGLNPRALQALSHKRLDRYYPFYESMFFWVGDMNSGAFMGSTNGYFGEYEHMAELRGFPAPETSFEVKASRFRESRFLPRTETEMTVTQRDFSALSPLLLAGINSVEVEKFKKRNRDVQMTVDAALQTQLQQSLQTLDTLRNSRISVVVMEDNTGDVLASAMYPAAPVADMERMTLTNAELSRLPYFLTNRDLGFTYASQPGSTAKLITAAAAFNKLGPAVAAKKYIPVRPGDLIRVRSEEPDETGNITIQRGIVRSNNPFFIRLANEERLEEEMGEIYLKAGLFLRGVGGYFFDADFKNADRMDKTKGTWRKTEFTSIRSYNRSDIRKTRGRGVSGMAWGQGELVATPAAMARVAAGIANNGTLMHSRYISKVSDSLLPVAQGIPLLNDPQSAQLLTQYMKEQSASKKDRLGITAAGKTGTPERIFRGERINDGWYVFFAPKEKGSGHVVVCVRVEKTKGSSVAVRLAGSHVVPVLKKFGYIKSFDDKASKLAGTGRPVTAPDAGL
jgi:cell division protein FtsI/penicillin-binding protein 2